MHEWDQLSKWTSAGVCLLLFSFPCFLSSFSLELWSVLQVGWLECWVEDKNKVQQCFSKPPRYQDKEPTIQLARKDDPDIFLAYDLV